MARLSFDQWKDRVSGIILHRVGLTADDLPDWCYYDSWQVGDTPSQAAVSAIRAAASTKREYKQAGFI